jgi:hypothetical protein
MKHLHWQLGGLGILREVIYGFSEEARIRSFASLTLVGFAFVSQEFCSAHHLDAPR